MTEVWTDLQKVPKWGERERIIEIVSSKIRCVKTLLINSVIKGEREEDGLQLFLDLFYGVN